MQEGGSLLSLSTSSILPHFLPLCQHPQHLCTHIRDFHTREQPVNLELTSPRYRPTVTSRLVLHSDVAARDTSLLGDNLQLIEIPNTPQWQVCSWACARAHVMGEAIIRARDSPHIRGAGKTSHSREMENCPTPESATSPHHCRRKPSSPYWRPPTF